MVDWALLELTIGWCYQRASRAAWDIPLSPCFSSSLFLWVSVSIIPQLSVLLFLDELRYLDILELKQT